ncbi:MAG TPA: hypothetical protein VJ950_03425 [Acidimicrobiia bacterium]|nr:hypothetical protein [Acidimicrobiia bacterium]
MTTVESRSDQPGVPALTDLRLRWQGHQLHVSASIAVDPNLTVAPGTKPPTRKNTPSTTPTPSR